jgi:TonB family protein
MIKAAVYLAAFYAVYTLLLSKDTMYGRNRLFILLSVVSSLILPLVTIQISRSINLSVFSRVLSDIFIDGNQVQAVSSTDTGMNGIQLVYRIYLTGVVIFGLKLIIDFAELFLLILRNKGRQSHIIRFQGLKTAGFSAFGHVFVNTRLSDEEVDEIIRHEQNHLDYYHSIDIIFIEIAKVIQWFNPFIYLFGRSLRAIHEYQADAGCIKTGIPVGNYQRLLLNQVFKSKIFTVTNSFSNPTLIKKRMIMMTKKRSNALANLKLLMVLPVIAIVLLVISSCSQKNEVKENVIEMAPPPPPPPPPVADTQASVPFVVVDEMPLFPGGDVAMSKFIMENTRYPEASKTKGIQGKVSVRFAVEADGSVDKVSILKGVDPELDKEAFRVISALPAFEKPGIKDGKKVAVWYAVPINFTLK